MRTVAMLLYFRLNNRNKAEGGAARFEAATSLGNMRRGRMRRFAILVSASGLLMTACTVQPAPSPLPTAPAPLPMPAPAPAPPPMMGTCDATSVQSAVGQPASPSVLEQVTLGSGAQSARVVHPGEAVTMEFNASRLTISVDGVNRITSLRCG